MPTQFETSWVVIAAVVGVFMLVCFMAWAASRYKKVGPNEALIVFGGGRMNIVVGGGRIVWPFVNEVQRLPLEIMTLEVTTPEVYTAQGVPVIVDGVAQVKIDESEESIRTAAGQFLGRPVQEVRNVALQTMEGHLRAILGTMTVESIYKERDEFAKRVQEQAAPDMANMGMRIVSFTIRDIRDNQGYLDALGKPRTAQVKRDATIGEAEAQRDAMARSAQANQEGQTARFVAETKIREAERDYETQAAQYKAAIATQQAQADLAYDMQKYTTEQQVKKQQVQVEVVEKEMQTEVQVREIKRKERELEAQVQKPADAERYRIETLASAERQRTIAEAEGQAKAAESIGVGKAAAARAEGLAQADVIRAQGLAEAEVTKQKGFAEAEAMMKKAEAWQNYNQAAITEKVVEVLPAVAAAIAQPLAKTERIVMVNTGGGDSGIGASKITNDITKVIAELPPIVEALSGVDFHDLLSRLPQIGEKVGQPPAESEAPQAPQPPPQS